MNKIFKRIGAILLALTLCFGTTLTAFAAEEGVEQYSTVSERSGSSGSFTDTTTLYVVVDAAKNNATVSAAVEGNPYGSYQVTIKDPSGNVIRTTEIFGSGVAATFNYSVTSGTYTFTFICLSYNCPRVTASGLIY